MVGEVSTKPCGDGYCDGLLLKRVTGRDVVWYSCDKNVQGDPNSCPFTANNFRPEHDPSKTQTKLICVICILPVNGAVSIGKKLEGESDEDGKASKCLFSSVFVNLFGVGYYSLYDAHMERELYHTAVQKSFLSFRPLLCIAYCCVSQFFTAAHILFVSCCVLPCVCPEI